MKHMMRSMIFVLLILLLAVGISAAQDVPPEATPTIEALTPSPSPSGRGEVTADVPMVVAAPVVTSGVDTAIFIAVVAVFSILLLGSGAIITYLTRLLGNSVKTEQIESLLASGQKWAYQQAMTTAARTPEQWDDNMIKTIAALLRYNPNVSVQQPSQPSPPTPLPQGEGSQPPVSTPEPVPPFVPVPDEPKLPKGIPINRNYALNEVGDNNLPFIEVDRDGRKIAVPIGYAYKGLPGAVDGKASAHCEVYYKPGQGFEFALADKAGFFGYEFAVTNFVLAGLGRFAVVCEYEANYVPIVGPDNNPTVYIGGSLNGGTKLPKQPIVATGKGEAQWVFATVADRDSLDAAIGVYMPYGSVDDHGTLLIKQIKIVPVADDYGDHHPSAIIRI